MRKSATLKLVPLALMMSLLIGCNFKHAGYSYDSNLHSYCPTPVRASDEVKTWFKSKKPIPEPVRKWLKDIGDEQEAILQNCYK
jgi:hypothetical protein